MGNSQELLLDFSGFWSADHTDTRRLAYAEKLPAGVALKDVISPRASQDGSKRRREDSMPADWKNCVPSPRRIAWS